MLQKDIYHRVQSYAHEYAQIYLNINETIVGGLRGTGGGL